MTFEFVRPNNGVAYADGNVADENDFNAYRTNEELLLLLSSLKATVTEVTAGATGYGRCSQLEWNQHKHSYYGISQFSGLGGFEREYCAGNDTTLFSREFLYAEPIDMAGPGTTKRFFLSLDDVDLYLYPSAASSTKTSASSALRLGGGSPWIVFTSVFSSATAIPFSLKPNSRIIRISPDRVYITGADNASSDYALLDISRSSGLDTYSYDVIDLDNLLPPYGPTGAAINDTASQVVMVNSWSNGYGVSVSTVTNVATAFSFTPMPNASTLQDRRIEYDALLSKWVIFDLSRTDSRFSFSTSQSGVSWTEPWRAVPISALYGASLHIHDAIVTTGGLWMLLISSSLTNEDIPRYTLFVSIDQGGNWTAKELGNISDEYVELTFARGGDSLIAHGSKSTTSACEVFLQLGAMAMPNPIASAVI